MYPCLCNSSINLYFSFFKYYYYSLQLLIHLWKKMIFTIFHSLIFTRCQLPLSGSLKLVARRLIFMKQLFFSKRKGNTFTFLIILMVKSLQICYYDPQSAGINMESPPKWNNSLETTFSGSYLNFHGYSA